MRIAGSTVLLTGATGGVGQALARELAVKGAKLVLSGRRAEALESVAAEFDARTVTADLADPDDVARLADACADVDILIANAALPSSGDLLDYTPEQIDRSLAVNLRTPVMLARLLAPRMVEAGRGHIALVGSISGKAATQSSSLYNATKFGLRGFALGLRTDLGPQGVGVSVVSPGFIREAGMFAESGASSPPGLGTATPEQVAEATVKAIEADKVEIAVAPARQRFLAHFGLASPGIAVRVSSGSAGQRSAAEIADGHSIDKR